MNNKVYKYGIDITNATLQTYAYELGIQKAVSEMTQAEKMQLRMIAILEQSKVSWGDLANTVESPSNQIRIFKNNLKELGMTIGQLFIPMLSKVLPVLNGLSVALKRLFIDIAGFFGVEIKLSEFGEGFTNIEDDVDGVTDSYDDATASLKEWKNQAMGFDEINPLKDTSDTSSGSGDAGGGGIDLTDEILDATDEYEKAWQEAYDRMDSKIEAIAKHFEQILSPLRDLFKDIAIGDWFSAGEDVSDIAKGIFNTFSNAIESVDWKKLGQNIGLFLKGIDWAGIFNSMIKTVREALKAMFELAISMLEEAPIESAILLAISAWKFSRVKKGMISIFTKHPIITAATIIAGIVINWDEVSDFLAKIFDEEIGTAEDFSISFKGQAIIDDIDKFNESYEQLAKTNKNSIEQIEAEYDGIREMAEEYLSLSENYNTLSDTQKNMVKTYSEQLSESLPDMKSSINEVTGAWEGTTKEMQTLIDKTEDYYLSIAKGEILQDLYTEKVKAEKSKKDAKSSFEEKSKEVFDYGYGTYQATGNYEYNQIAGLAGELYEVGGDLNKLSPTSYKLYKHLVETNEVASSMFREMVELGDAYREIDDTILNINSDIRYYEGAQSRVTENTQATYDIAQRLNDTLYDIVSQKELNISTENAETNIENLGNQVDNASKTNIDMSIVDATNKTNILGTNIRDVTSTNLNLNTTNAYNAVGGIVNKLLEPIPLALGINKDNLKNVANSIKETINTTLGATQAVASVGLASLINIRGYATGGFPDNSSLFFAGENGIPELLGTVGGKTAVAGGQEITGIRDEIRNTGVAEIELLRQQNELLQQLLQKDMGISEKSLFKSIQRQANNYTRQTGQSAFSY